MSTRRRTQWHSPRNRCQKCVCTRNHWKYEAVREIHQEQTRRRANLCQRYWDSDTGRQDEVRAGVMADDITGTGAIGYETYRTCGRTPPWRRPPPPRAGRPAGPVPAPQPQQTHWWLLSAVWTAPSGRDPEGSSQMCPSVHKHARMVQNTHWLSVWCSRTKLTSDGGLCEGGHPPDLCLIIVFVWACLCRYKPGWKRAVELKMLTWREDRKQ